MQKPAASEVRPLNKPIVLVGNPNVGKSVIFAYLTGRYAVVSNFPGTTVEVSKGRSILDKQTEIIDTPGANSLHPHSVDEQVTRNILCSHSPRVILQVADAKNLRRSLTITSQLAEMGLPVVLDLNMMDEARRRRIDISAKSLEAFIQVPVVQTVAIEKRGFKILEKALSDPPRVPQITVTYPGKIEKGIEKISQILPDMQIKKRSVALMCLSNWREVVESFKEQLGEERIKRIGTIVDGVQEAFANPLGYIIGVSRSQVVDRLLDEVYHKGAGDLIETDQPSLKKKRVLFALSITVFSMLLYIFAGVENLGAWGLHPPLLHLVVLSFLLTILPGRFFRMVSTHPVWGALVLIEVLYLVYKCVGVFGAGTLVDLLENKLFAVYLIPAISDVMNRFVHVTFLHDLLIGPYGLISMGITYAVAIVLPIVGMFFLVFGILEDSGYLPRLAVIADKGMKRMGLNGKAVLPMVLGLGCDTMATLTARILDSKKERIIATLLLALAIPCSAQLGVIMAMVAGSSISVAVTVFIVITSQLFLIGSIAGRLIEGRQGDFIIELPPLRIPKFKNIILKTYHRLRWFLFEAVPLFLAGTLILFILEKIGGLKLLQRIAEPVIVKMMGLPIESTAAFIIGFFRRDYGAAGLYDLFLQGSLSHNQVAVSMVTITLFVPCIAQFLVMIKERGIKIALAISAFILPYAILIGTILSQFLKLAGIEL
jgi:ferrous iron transport protein B